MKLKDFGWTYNVHRFALNEQSVAQLREKAAADDPEACYMYGRYHYCVRPEPNSVSQALELYKKALSGGVADANVAIAIMWSEGDMGDFFSPSAFKISSLLSLSALICFSMAS